MGTYICGGGKYGGEGRELHGGAASIGEGEGEHHIRPGLGLTAYIVKRCSSAALYNHRKWEWDSKTSRWRQLA